MRRRIAYSFVRIQPLSAPPIDTLAVASPVMSGPSLAARLVCEEPSASVAVSSVRRRVRREGFDVRAAQRRAIELATYECSAPPRSASASAIGCVAANSGTAAGQPRRGLQTPCACAHLVIASVVDVVFSRSAGPGPEVSERGAGRHGGP
jgi:hypothetical protein